MKVLVYILRPNGEILWMPPDLCEKMGLKHGDRLTKEQYASRNIADLIAARQVEQGARRKV